MRPKITVLVVVFHFFRPAKSKAIFWSKTFIPDLYIVLFIQEYVLLVPKTLSTFVPRSFPKIFSQRSVHFKQEPSSITLKTRPILSHSERLPCENDLACIWTGRPTIFQERKDQGWSQTLWQRARYLDSILGEEGNGSSGGQVEREREGWGGWMGDRRPRVPKGQQARSCIRSIRDARSFRDKAFLFSHCEDSLFSFSLGDIYI